MSGRSVVTRRIRLPANWARGLGEELAEEVRHTEPACGAAYDPRHHALALTYDRMRIGFVNIEPILIRRHVWPPSGWLGRLRRAWILYTEANVRDHARTPPPACGNRPPHRPAGSA